MATKNVTVGDFEKKFSKPADITIRFAGQYIVILNEEIVAPNNTTERVWKAKLNKGDKLEIQTEGRWTMKDESKEFSGEKANTVSMVEIVPDGELSMLERYKAEMMQYISNFATDQGYETEEEANDFDWEDEEGLIATPYEYNEMMAEFPIDEAEDQQEEQEEETTDTTEEKKEEEAT